MFFLCFFSRDREGSEYKNSYLKQQKRHQFFDFFMPDMKTKTKLNERLTIWQMADLFGANISANKISLPQGKRNQPFTVLPTLHSVLL